MGKSRKRKTVLPAQARGPQPPSPASLAPTAVTRAAPSKWSSINAAAATIGNLAQVGMLVLGVVGYIYTVRPVFQTAQLQEQASQLELEKKASEKLIVSLQAEKERVSRDLLAQQEILEAKRAEGARLVAVSEAAKRKANEALQGEQRARESYALQSEALTRLQREFARQLFSQSYASAYAVDSARPINQQWTEEAGDSDPIKAAEAFWPDPFKLLTQALHTVQASDNAHGIPDALWGELNAKVMSLKAESTCEPPDFKALRLDYNAKLAGLSAEAEVVLATQMQDVSAEYSRKGTRAVFSEEFKAESKRRILLSKQIAVRHELTQRLRQLRLACDNKGFDVLKKLK